MLDSSKARMFSSRPGKNEFALVQEISNPQGRAHGRTLVTDRPGRSFDSHTRSTHSQTGASRHSLSSRLSPHGQAVESFLSKLAKYLETKSHQEQFSQLIVFAEPHLWGRLQKMLGPSLKKQMLKREWDLAWLPTSQVIPRLHAA
ncbi:MAG: host attachment protein [Deltaproteobacteria bacterium]|nr:host attachment protein [Deltaproteobacteria bacterium]